MIKNNTSEKRETPVEPRIYLDYAASTPLSNETKKLVVDLLDEYANPSSIHREGVRERSRIEGARKRVSQLLGATPDEIFFTSGSTESLNIAIRGVIDKARETIPLPHAITSAIEHPAILETLKALERAGAVSVDYLTPDAEGVVSDSDLQKTLKKETVLIAFSLINSEIGTVLPHEKYTSVLRNFRKKVTGEKYPHVLIDATQAPLYYEVNVQKVAADLLVLDGSKMGGLKGSGLLYSRRGTGLSPTLFGGGQEGGLRPGTQNSLAIETLAATLETAQSKASLNSEKMKTLSQGFIEKLKVTLCDVSFNGSVENRSPHIVSVCFPEIDAEWLVLQLDAAGISVSRGSACKSKSGNESEVLSIINPRCKESSVRFSFGNQTTEEEIGKTVEIITHLVSAGVSFPR
ncbi:MAG: cysteine desulfurase family protein [Candidatus Paceibacterota bacterium]